jgi:hypothetical protein
MESYNHRRLLKFAKFGIGNVRHSAVVGIMSFGIVKFGIPDIRHSVVWHFKIRHSVVRHSVVWHSVVRHSDIAPSKTGINDTAPQLMFFLQGSVICSSQIFAKG